ncbi:hypothetical protein FXO38_03006 [Capsicum annuum]|nr:hypothetical protein FXO38_03006 [Capsicum annuum]
MEILVSKLRAQGWSSFLLQGNHQRRFGKDEVYEFYTHGVAIGEMISTSVHGKLINFYPANLGRILSVPTGGWGHYMKGSWPPLDNLPSTLDICRKFSGNPLFPSHRRLFDDVKRAADLLTATIGDCGYPTVCWNYSVCGNGKCSCPQIAVGPSNFLQQINYRQKNQGCLLVTPISCEHSQYHVLMEHNETGYIPRYLQYGTHKTELENCRRSCLSNCSCKAAQFRLPGPDNMMGHCALLNEGRRKQLEEAGEEFLDQVPGMPSRFSDEELTLMTEYFS